MNKTPSFADVAEGDARFDPIGDPVRRTRMASSRKPRFSQAGPASGRIAALSKRGLRQLAQRRGKIRSWGLAVFGKIAGVLAQLSRFFDPQICRGRGYESRNLWISRKRRNV